MVYIHDDILTNGFVAFYVDESFHLLISLFQLSLQHCPIPTLVFSEITQDNANGKILIKETKHEQHK
jgi:hypothetical protein